MILSVDNISKTFKLSRRQRIANHNNEKYKTAVNGLSFYAAKGEIFGLLGPNGAGKTTTLRMLSTLIKPDAGSIVIDGIDAVKEPEKARERIGFLTSELKLEEYFTPSYMFDFFASLYNIPEEKKQARKKELFEKFGINDYAETKIGNLSTGMKQKVSIVISIIHDPDIIIFDEPTNGLDVITAKVVTDFLEEAKKEGKCIVVSTHIFSLAEKLCDRVGIIIDGKMMECDTLENLTKEKNIEDKFFDIYEEAKGGTAGCAM